MGVWDIRAVIYTPSILGIDLRLSPRIQCPLKQRWYFAKYAQYAFRVRRTYERSGEKSIGIQGKVIDGYKMQSREILRVV